jgi:uncharacterized membrane protein
MNPPATAERIASSIAVVALGVWIGGMVALGACAAPIVFGMVPAPLSGDAMGAVFRRFDAIAVGCAVVALGAEAVRIALHEGAATLGDRARGAAVLVASACAIAGAIAISPKIVALHAAGAIRGLGPDGTELERFHHMAETLGTLEVALGLAAIVLHVSTLRASSAAPAAAPASAAEDRPLAP